MANTVWAFATASVEAPQLFEAIAAEATGRIGEFRSRDMANAVWAFAKADVAAPQLFDAIAAEASSRITEFNSQDVANTAWAFAKAGVAAPRLFQAIADEAPRRIDEFYPQAMANTAWAFAKAGAASPQLFDAIAAAARLHIGEFKPQEMANTVWAFAISRSAPRLFEAIASETSRRVGDFNSKDLASTAWALACVAWPDRQIFEDLGLAIAGRLDEMTEPEQSQLYLVALQMRTQWPDLNTPLAAHVETFRRAYARFEPQPSQLQRDVSAALAALGWSHDFEHRTQDGFSLDMADPASKWAVEVDGPTHFLRDVSSGEFVVTGATTFKARLLREAGWTLSSLSYFDFLGRTDAEQAELLADLLRRRPTTPHEA
eukprot:CAMPEP_0198661732 /NCGR_PEP_ID=MMETSP1467-20131203/43658_1 /TAXON_ID=1462469 /ORGANISM="unid. sp., Strain CCMP2135" /LENGTH=373 /DNA_ID=CAMNT_0044398189 /DNA_START=1 /DNA_END=1118 /DNA_ORIENTATION=-